MTKKILSFRLYILSFMKDKRVGFPAGPIRSILRFLSWIYTAVISVIDWTWRSGLRKRYKIAVPVVSIGNITLGGTGKTPFAVFLADHFSAAGRKPAILIRGYGEDESRMLKDELPDIPVFTGQDRVRSARQAVADKRDVLILDDGFQHRRIDRDLNILMLDAGSMFGNGLMFPRGILREPVSALERADILVLAKTDKLDPVRRETAVHELERFAPGKPVVFARHRLSFLNDVTGAAYETGILRGKNVILLSGIADPDYFAFLVEKEGAVIISKYDYGDHHRYVQTDIGNVYAESIKKKTDMIVTTGKDYVKLRELDISGVEDKLFVLNITIDIGEGKERLVGRLNSVIAR